MSDSFTVIAIDGPAASGKSSVAKALARRLGFVYVNTGEMYRAVTWQVLQSGVDPKLMDAVRDCAVAMDIECGVEDRHSIISVNGANPGDALVGESVNAAVSLIAKVPEVRQRLVDLQREYASRCDSVMEGRDIGSIVFPETPYKFYIDASEEVRAARRAKQGLKDSIGQRDKQDSTRRNSPLVIAEDAHVIDSSHLTIDGVTGEIIGRLKMKGYLQSDF
jgi:cytidylate kinase